MKTEVISNNLAAVAAETENQKHSVPFRDYSSILTGLNIEYIESGPYCYVEKHAASYNWALNISALADPMISLLNILLPYLEAQGATYKIPQNSLCQNQIMDGNFGYDQIAKTIIIYPQSDEQALILSNHLIKITSQFESPRIPDAYYLGGNLFVTPMDLSDGLTGKGNEIKGWPFKTIAKKTLAKSPKLLNRKYLILQSLKNDAKGNVYKGFNLIKWLDIKWCLIKQGKQLQCSDRFGRTIKDRLEWQYNTQGLLYDKVSLPKPIDFFELNGDTYLIMEFIEGRSFHDFISEFQKGVTWFMLPGESQAVLIKHLIELTDLVKSFHDNGFLHRDLNPVNFIVNESNKLVAIDIELSYNIQKNEPEPIFTLGTEGYMSPAQAKCEDPCIGDDIFGLGSLMIRTFTGISPTKFLHATGDKLFNDLNYFLRNKRISSMLCACWAEAVGERPNINSIRHNLELYLSQVITGNHADPNAIISCDPGQIKKLIHKGLNAICIPPLLSVDGKWLSTTIQEQTLLANDFNGRSWYPGFQTGTSGPLYLLTIADQQGFDLGSFRPIYYANFELVKSTFSKNLSTASSGLNQGAAGFAIVMATMIKYGLLENSLQNMNFIAYLLATLNESLTIADGLAGIGLAMLKCRELLDFPTFTSGIDGLAENIIRAQNKDGSWDIKRNPTDKKGIKLTGHYNGAAGIIYFLMLYGDRFYSSIGKHSAKRGLDWLIKIRKLDNGFTSWPVNSQNPTVDPWLENGFSGIAFMFLHAYKVYHDEAYKEIAIQALLNHPEFLTSNYTSQAQGISGLGEIYLEAYQILNQPEWLQRAEKLIESLCHTFKEAPNESIYWLDGSDGYPKADFGVGNAGILHFMLRYTHRDKVRFPLITF